MGIKISKVKILNKIILNNRFKQLNIQLKSHELEIKINIGEKSKYNNNIVFTQSNGLNKIYFDKIFNGTKIEKEIIIRNGKIKSSFLLKDHDCFVKFFGLDVDYLLSLKKNNLKLLENNILLLNKIKSKIKSD